MKRILATLLPVWLLFFASAALAQTGLTIGFMTGGSGGSKTSEMSTCVHDAHAICSLIHEGKQYLNDYDHGRQLQSAVSFDGLGENYNPTEAGASYLTDGYNPSPSSSQNLSAVYGNPTSISTSTRAAYWNPRSGVKLSNWIFTKNVRFFSGLYTHYFRHDVTIQGLTGVGEPTHATGTFEFTTSYMPAEFSSFYTLDVKGSQQLMSITDCNFNYEFCSPEQPKPLILATPDGVHAMGVYNRQSPQATYPGAGFGRWRFPADGVVKLNNVFRYTNIAPGVPYTYTGYMIVGTLANVKLQMQWLYDNGY